MQTQRELPFQEVERGLRPIHQCVGQWTASISDSRYEGYILTAKAVPAHAHLYAADLVVELPDHKTRRFHGLDYFYDCAQALRYSLEWGRLWLKNNVRSSPVSRRDLGALAADHDGFI